MTRLALILTALAPSAAVAGVIPPVPRVPEAALKGLKAEPPAEGEAESPEKIAERIAQNTKAARDRLAGQDTGSETQKTQDQVLKDIDALLKQAENPPPMGGGGGQSNDQSDMNQSKQGSQSQSQGGGQQQPKGGKQNPSGGQQPKGGGQQQPKGGSWRDRRNQEKGGQDKQPMGKGDQPMGKGEPMPMGDQPGPMPMGGMGDPKQPAGPNQPGGMNPGLGGNRASPALPLDEAITKQVWGHLPERLRQQMTQYYREQFMPRYDELLKQYYSSLAEREKAQKK